MPLFHIKASQLTREVTRLIETLNNHRKLPLNSMKRREVDDKSLGLTDSTTTKLQVSY